MNTPISVLLFLSSDTLLAQLVIVTAKWRIIRVWESEKLKRPQFLRATCRTGWAGGGRS
uniref:Uncharacterized protein n=1 Tax=Zea mays TaxID=4577 RepID=C4J300_MAIZE|nr:unknown [Zea mays]